MNNLIDKAGPVDSSQPEKFAWVTDPTLLKKAGFGRLVIHKQKPRFIGRVDLQKGSIKLIKQIDNLNAWAEEHIIPGKHRQAALLELLSATIEWARTNEDNWIPQNETVWSPLPKEGFFTGKPATLDDLERGDAYFVLENGQPIEIAIPQYAYAFDAKTNEPIPCIILQAEQEPRGDKIAAFLNLRTKKEQLGYFDSLILLGKKNPEIQPSRLATPLYEHLHKAFKNLSALVSTEKGVISKRKYLANNQKSINALLDDGLKNCSPLEYFTLLDGMKSLVSRDLLLKKRAVSMGQPEPDVMLHTIDVDQTCSILEDDPEICVFSIYQSPEEEFFGLFLFVEASEIRAERIPIATGSVGRTTAEQLRDLIDQKMWAVPEKTERLLFPLLELFGSVVIPRLQKLEGSRKLILIPHRWTHILPLHIMMIQNGNTVLTLDDVVTATTFAPSLTSFQWSFKSHFSAVRPKKAKPALLCLDIENLGSGAQFELTAYKNMFADVEGVDIVTTTSDIPNDLSVYPIILWSSHGVSDPTNWERNRLLFQSEVFSAERISKAWDLRTAFVAILAACETGIDLSADEMLDEYYGLDMALQIAGCSTVVSTMWKVEDIVAGYTAVQLLEGVFQNHSPSSHLRIIRHLFKSGNWHRMVQMAYQLVREDTSVSKKRYRQRLEGLEHLLSLPKDAFAHPSQWGVFRNFGWW